MIKWKGGRCRCNKGLRLRKRVDANKGTCSAGGGEDLVKGGGRGSRFFGSVVVGGPRGGESGEKEKSQEKGVDESQTLLF